MLLVRPLESISGRVAMSAIPVLWLASASAAAVPALSLDSVPTLVVFTPVSVEWDPRDHTLWIADQYLPRIVHAQEDGSPISSFAAKKYAGGRPAGMALDSAGAGQLYVSDPDFLRIVRVDQLGNPTGAFDTGHLGIGNPADLAWDSRDGSLYVADPTARAVFHLRPIDANADGILDGASLLDSFGTAPFGSDNPMGVALDPGSAHLYISDPALDRIFEVTSTGSLVSSFDTGAYGGGSVTGLGWEYPGGRLHLADAARKLMTFSPAGAPLNSQGTAPFGTLSPQGVAWDATTSTLVAVSGERKMIRFQSELPEADGTVGGIYLHRQEWTTTFGSISPAAIALDPGGTDRFVLDSFQARVFRVNPQGGVVSTFDTGPAGSTSPTGLAQGPAASGFYITDNVARKVFQISPTGSLLGSFSTSPFKHKPQGEPLCNDPAGIAYDGTLDHFFVVDYQAARVFEITRTGTFVASFPTAPASAWPTDVAVDPQGDRIIVSDSSGSFAEYSRSGVFLVKYPGVPLRLRMSGSAGVSVEPATLNRVIHDATQDAVYFVSKNGAALSQISLEPYGLGSPSGAAWLAAGAKLFVVDQALQRLYAITGGPDGLFGTADDSSTWISTAAFGSYAPTGIALNPNAGKAGWVDEATVRLYWVDLSLGYLGSVDLSPAGATAPRGVDQDPTSAQIFSNDPASGLLISGPAGNLLQATPWTSLGVADAGGVGLSPSEGVLLTVDRASRTLVSIDLRAYFLPEVASLEFLDALQLSWSTTPIFASYQLFRGEIASLQVASYGGCFWNGTLPPVPESQNPLEGSGWFYLVAGRNPTGVGALGATSGGTPRPLAAVSPACP